MVLLMLVGCADFKSEQLPGSGDSTGDPGVSTSGGESSSSGAASASGGSSDPESTSTSTSEGDSATTTGAMDDGESTGAPVDDGSSGDVDDSLPYAGDYVGNFSGNCGIGFDGTVTATIDMAGLISGSASAAGQTAPLSGLVSNVGTVSGSLTVVGIPCTLSGTMADDGSGGSGMFSCASVMCSGPWSLSAL